MAETIKIGGELESIATGKVVAAASAIKDKVKNKYQGEINAETDASLADRYTKAETNAQINAKQYEIGAVEIDDVPRENSEHLVRSGAIYKAYSNQVYLSEEGTTEPASFDPQADTLHKGSQVLSDAEKKQARANLGFGDGNFDETPTPGSERVVKSGDVFNSVISSGAFDLSAHTGDNYADLSAALTAMNALSSAYKKGGMSVKFVQSSDNKYVQYRLMATSFSTTESDWQGVDDEPTPGSENLVESGGVVETIFSNYHTLSKTGLSERWDAFLTVPIEAGRTYEITIEAAGYNYIYLRDHTFVKGSDSGVTLLNLTTSVAPKTFYYKATTTETAYIVTYSPSTYSISVKSFIEEKDLSPIYSDTQNVSIKKIDGTFVQNGVITESGTITTTSDHTVNEYSVTKGDSILIKSRISTGDAYSDRAFAFAYLNNTPVAPIVKPTADNKRCCYSYNVPEGVNRILVYNNNSYEQAVYKSEYQKAVYENLNSIIKDINTSVDEIEDIVFLDNRVLTTADYYKDSNNWEYYFYDLALNVGSIAPASPTKYNNSQWGCLRTEVPADTTVKVYTIGGGNGRAYAVTDLNRKILVVAAAGENTLSNPFTYKFTEDGYLYVNCTPANTSSFKVVIEKTIQDEIDDSNSRIENLENTVGDTITRLNVQSPDYGYFEEDGSIYSSDTRGISNYINVEGWETVKTISNAFSASGTYPFCILYGSENQDDIVKIVVPPTQTYYPNGVTVQIPSGAKFARFATEAKATDLVIELYRNNLDIRLRELKEPVNEYDSLPAVDTENPMANIVRGAGAAASIMSWGVIGASFESGTYEYYKNGSGTGNMYRNTEMSWPQMFARMNGISMQNFTLPGNTIKMWCNNTSEYGWGDTTQGASKPENKKQAYIIVISSNDPYNKDCPIGDVTTDIQEDYANNANTFCGWLGGAIQRIRSVAQHCMIFVSNVRNDYAQGDAHYQDVIDYNEAIESVVEYFDDVFLLDIFKYGLKWYDPVVKNKYMLVGHGTPMGYLVMAYHYNTLIDSIIRTHQQQFALTAFINSSYESDIDWNRR